MINVPLGWPIRIECRTTEKGIDVRNAAIRAWNVRGGILNPSHTTSDLNCSERRHQQRCVLTVYRNIVNELWKTWDKTGDDCNHHYLSCEHPPQFASLRRLYKSCQDGENPSKDYKDVRRSNHDHPAC